MVIYPSLSLLSLPEVDILFAHILPKLKPEDWISLSKASKSTGRLITSFLFVNKSLRIEASSTTTAMTFTLLTHDSTKLHHLNLHNCDWVTDDLLRPVLRNNPALTSIDLSGCKNLTEGVLQMVSMMCPSISSLILSDCPWVGSTVLGWITSVTNISRGICVQVKAWRMFSS